MQNYQNATKLQYTWVFQKMMITDICQQITI